ncbi:mechanosensitive ion channel domain-containing protein [Hoeflea alexandrii]|uniref:mechanosensitive ion channel domain-containing protein n=1 Tax=Hoeflea alexandrii TaxID=288436 RepID=UPI0035CFA16A
MEELLSVLRDEVKRNALIERLEALDSAGSSEGESGAAPGATNDTAVPAPSLARQVADFTQSAAQSTYQTVAAVWRDFSGIGVIASGIEENRIERIVDNGPLLGLTMLSVFALLYLLTAMTLAAVSRLAPGNTSALNTVLTVILGALGDVVALGLAYATGYALSVSVFGSGALSLEQTLFLNAFLVAGIARIVIRVLVRADRPEQAVFSFAPPVQATIARRLTILSGVLVYGISAIVPITNVWISFVAGQSLRVIVVTLAALIAVLSIRRVAVLVDAARASAKNEFASEHDPDAGDIADALTEETAEATVSLFHRIWPLLGYLYVGFAYIIAITRPGLMADLVGLATLKTVIAGGFLALALRFMRGASTTGAPLPKALSIALPELKTRLDGFVPAVLRFASAALIVVAIGFVLSAWQIVDVVGFVSGPFGSDLIWRLVSAMMIVALIVLLWAVLSSWIDNRLSLDLEGRNVSARSRTLLALFRNAFTVALFVFGTMTALSQLGIDIAPLLAGAGVIGLAIGFGSQKLVQDIITGVFIQLDNAINEGDVITVAGITGGVEKLTIRSVGLRDLHGTYHIVPFSSVDTVSNFMRNFAFHVAEIGVAYKESIPAVKDAMHEAFGRLKATDHAKNIIGDLEMHGVVALADSSVNLRARIRTRPGQQWGIGRDYTQLVKEVFDERGIEIPFPHRQMVYPSPSSLDVPSNNDVATKAISARGD